MRSTREITRPIYGISQGFRSSVPASGNYTPGCLPLIRSAGVFAFGCLRRLLKKQITTHYSQLTIRYLLLTIQNSEIRIHNFFCLGDDERQIWRMLCPNISAFAGPIPSTVSKSSGVVGRACTMARNVRSLKTKKAGRRSFRASASRQARSFSSSAASSGEKLTGSGGLLPAELRRFGLTGS